MGLGFLKDTCYNWKMPKRKSQKSAKKELQVETQATQFERFGVINKVKKPKVFIPLIIIALIIVAFLFKGLFVAALVNGQPISRLSLVAELEKQGGSQVMASLINQALILQEAKKKNIEVSQKEIDDSVKEIEDSLKEQGQDLNTALTSQNLSREDFITQIKLRKIVEKLLADQVKVEDKEVNDYIEINKETLPTDLEEDELRKKVSEQLRQQKLATKSQELLANLNKDAKIQYFVNYLNPILSPTFFFF